MQILERLASSTSYRGVHIELHYEDRVRSYAVSLVVLRDLLELQKHSPYIVLLAMTFLWEKVKPVKATTSQTVISRINLQELLAQTPLPTEEINWAKLYKICTSRVMHSFLTLLEFNLAFGVTAAKQESESEK